MEPTPFEHPQDQETNPSLVELPHSPDHLAAYIDRYNLNVSPGHTVRASVILYNQGRERDTFETNISGISSEWLPNPTIARAIDPGKKSEFKLIFAPPRSPSNRAGRHKATVLIRGQSRPDETLEFSITLTLSAFSAFTSALAPTRITSGTAASIRIQNKSNHPETFTISWDNPGDSQRPIIFDPQQEIITIQPAKTGVIQFTSSPRKHRWSGQKSIPFSVQVNTPSGNTQELAGEFVSRGLIPTKILIPLATLFLLLICILPLFIAKPWIPPTPSPGANQLVNIAPRSTALPPSNASISPTQATVNLGSPSDQHLETTPTVEEPPLPASADLVVSITDGQDSAMPGANVIYTLVIENHGPAAAKNVRIEHILPDELVNVIWSCSATIGSQCQPANGNGPVDSTISLGVNGEAKFFIAGAITPNASGLLINKVEIIPPQGLHDPKPINNQAIDIDSLSPQASFHFTITDGLASVAPGEPIQYNITIKNNGPSAITKVNIENQVPDVIGGATWICSASEGGNCMAGGVQYDDVRTSVALPPGGIAVIKVTGIIRHDAQGVLSNTATLSLPSSPDVMHLTSSDSTKITPQADLVLSVSAPPPATSTNQLTYTFHITNNGPSVANNIILTSHLPFDDMLIMTEPGEPACKHDSGVITCHISALQPEGTTQFKITVNIPSGQGSLISHASVSADEPDPNPENNAVTSKVQVR